ncbi:peritrophin-1 [Orussus abietinus]|uniref:peritrophin-1 n=1 Tax=Orussus abietinus TaxID=222816 RepID=UPI0006266048|nr:peritrophin-1 [Orussus abietinus]
MHKVRTVPNSPWAYLYVESHNASETNMKVILGLTFLALVAITWSLDSGDVPVDCPEINEENATLLANPYDCGSYYVCETGEAILLQCPDDLHFNDELKVCDWPYRANCTAVPNS